MLIISQTQSLCLANPPVALFDLTFLALFHLLQESRKSSRYTQTFACSPPLARYCVERERSLGKWYNPIAQVSEHAVMPDRRIQNHQDGLMLYPDTCSYLKSQVSN